MKAFRHDKEIGLEVDTQFSFVHLHFKGTEAITFEKQYTHICALPLEGYAQICSGYDKIKVAAHECVFVRRTPLSKTILHPDKTTGEFNGILMELDRDFMINYFRTISRSKLPTSTKRAKRICTPLPRTERLERIAKEVCTMVENNTMTEEISQQLRYESIDAMLHLSPEYYPIFFDFYKPYKINIQEYIGLIYNIDMNIEDMALFASRSKAAFKRDVITATGTSPERAIIEMRLIKAHELITQEHVKPTRIHQELGFKSKQHFFARYKAKYNATPTADYNNYLNKKEE